MSAIQWLITTGVVAIFIVLLSGCGFFPESTFQLAPDSRLPRWFVLPPGLRRDQVSVRMDYYSGLRGGSATMMLRGPTGQVLQQVSGKTRGDKPTQLKIQPAGFPPGYPAFEIITVNAVTDAVEHRRLEPIFYCVDDPKVLTELGVKNWDYDYAYVGENPMSREDPLGLCPTSALSHELCVTNYLNSTYGTFGGFVASTFNMQQSIPGLSGDTTLNTLALDAELAAVKQGIPWALRTVGGIFNIFTTPSLLEIIGVSASTGLALFGAATVPFATMATSIANGVCSEWP